MTLKQAQKEAREHGMSIRKTPAGDYRINFKNGPESQAVYEDTIIDAYGTAIMMFRKRHRFATKW